MLVFHYFVKGLTKDIHPVIIAIAIVFELCLNAIFSGNLDQESW